jgi:hypothetical protein
MIEVTVTGADELVRKFGKFEVDKSWQKVVVPQMETHQTEVGKYPTLKALTYTRTGTLGKKWYVKTPELETKVGNRASYAQWVHGAATQTFWSAAYKWKRIDEGLQARVKRITKLLGDALERQLE